MFTLFKREKNLFGKKHSLPAPGAAPTYVGQGMKIEGKLRCRGPIRIDGEVRGTIECENELTIGPSGHVMASINAARIVVNGRIEGNLFTSDHLEVLEEGHVIGNVSNPPGRLVVREGAIIEGQCLTYVVKEQKKLDPPAKMLVDPKVPAKEAVPRTMKMSAEEPTLKTQKVATPDKPATPSAATVTNPKTN